MSQFPSRRPQSNASSAAFAPGSSNFKANHHPSLSNPSRSQQQLPSGHTTGGSSQRSGGAFSRPSRAASTVEGASDSPLVIDGPGGRILCVADVRGNLKTLNDLAVKYNAQAVIHTGDFGFYISDSLDRISDKTLRHNVQYSSLIPHEQRTKLLAADQPRGAPISGTNYPTTNLRSQISSSPTLLLSEFPQLLDGTLRLNVPVFTVWGACEDVVVLERIRVGEYQIPNLQVLDEATTRAIHIGDIRLRLFGLGGAVVLHKLFDNGEGAATIAGGQGIMWTTMLQIGELVDTAQKTFDPTETRVLITHASPGREGLLAQLAVVLKADLTISAGLHFRYGISYNEFGVQHDSQNYRNKMVSAKAAFSEVWDGVKTQVEEAVDAQQRILLDHALVVTNRIPSLSTATGAVSEEYAWKNTWNWNLPDAAYGSLVLDINEGRLGAETYSSGFNFAYRKASTSSVATGVSIASQPALTSPVVKPQPPVHSSSSVAPQLQAARAPSTTAVPARPGDEYPVGGPETARATPLSSPLSSVRSPPTGPASSVPLAGIKSPPSGPKGYQQHQHIPALHPRGGRTGGVGRKGGSLPNGSAPNTDTEGKEPGTKKQQLQDREKDKPASAPPTPADTAKTTTNTSGTDTKNKKPRQLKKGKGGQAPGETSGAEALTSGNESAVPNTKKAFGGQGQQDVRRKEGKDKDKDKDKAGESPSTPRTNAVTSAPPAGSTAALTETSGVKSSGDEGLASTAGGPPTRGGKNGGRGIRGGGGGGRGRGGKGSGGGRLGGAAGTGTGTGTGATSAASPLNETSAPSAPVPAPAPAPTMT